MPRSSWCGRVPGVRIALPGGGIWLAACSTGLLQLSADRSRGRHGPRWRARLGESQQNHGTRGLRPAHVPEHVLTGNTQHSTTRAHTGHSASAYRCWRVTCSTRFPMLHSGSSPPSGFRLRSHRRQSQFSPSSSKYERASRKRRALQDIDGSAPPVGGAGQR